MLQEGRDLFWLISANFPVILFVSSPLLLAAPTPPARPGGARAVEEARTEKRERREILEDLALQSERNRRSEALASVTRMGLSTRSFERLADRLEVLEDALELRLLHQAVSFAALEGGARHQALEALLRFVDATPDPEALKFSELLRDQLNASSEELPSLRDALRLQTSRLWEKREWDSLRSSERLRTLVQKVRELTDEVARPANTADWSRLQEIKAILAEEPALSRHPIGEPFLLWAARSRQSELGLALVEAGFSPFGGVAPGAGTPLSWAIRSEDRALVQALLQASFLKVAGSSREERARLESEWYPEFQKASLFLEGERVLDRFAAERARAAHLVRDEARLRELILAVTLEPGPQRAGELEQVRIYFREWPEILKRPSVAATLFRVIEKGDRPLFRLLLEKGAPINALREREGVTPLMAAVERGEVEMVGELLQAGAFVHAFDRRGLKAWDRVRPGDPRAPQLRMILGTAMGRTREDDSNRTARWFQRIIHACPI